MALEHLLAALERDTEEQVSALLQEAAARAAAIRDETESAVTEQLATFEHRRRTALTAEAGTEVAEARERAGRRRLEARAAFLSAVFERARERLDEAAAREAGRAALVEQAREAVSFLGGAPGLLRCSPALAEPLTAAFPAGTSVEIRPDRTAPPGFTVTTADGHLTVDGTLAPRLERLRPQLAVDLMARVEAGG